MNFKEDPDLAAFREEVRTFLKATLPSDLAERTKLGFHPLREDTEAWTKVLNRQGWSVPSWPKEHGGPGWSLMQRHIFEEESFLAGAPQPSPLGTALAGPIIFTFGTPEQCERYLPKIRNGDEYWAQGFSEPSAGSDLVSLKTRAEIKGDHYVVNGQKTWSTEAQYSDMIFLLARTDPLARPHQGISMLLVPTNTPGITVRPIITLDSGHSVNEMFFDNVVVPCSNLVGQEGMGWTYAKHLLELERAFSAELPRNRRDLRRLSDLLNRRQPDGRRLIDDPIWAGRFAELESEFNTLEFLTLRALAAASSGDEPVASGVLKICGSELLQKIGLMSVDVLGEAAAELIVDHSVAHDPADIETLRAPGIVADMLYHRAATIYGGANEVQRNIIAKQNLGL